MMVVTMAVTTHSMTLFHVHFWSEFIGYLMALTLGCSKTSKAFDPLLPLTVCCRPGSSVAAGVVRVQLVPGNLYRLGLVGAG